MKWTYLRTFFSEHFFAFLLTDLLTFLLTYSLPHSTTYLILNPLTFPLRFFPALFFDFCIDMFIISCFSGIFIWHENIPIFFLTFLPTLFPTSLWGSCFLPCIPPRSATAFPPRTFHVMPQLKSHTQFISHNSFNTTLIPHTTLFTQLITQHISHNSSHTTHPTQLISHN